jgi:hypothetical protein
VNDKEPPKAPGVWVPYALLGTLLSIIIFVITFIGSVRVMDHRLMGTEERIKTLALHLENEQVAQHQLENRITRLESRQGEPR